ncbi:TorF family putative porin, partial [Escherichia coli]|uniref:TorF family putative porin n=1 Tax=Escherichia coli TaxID=562 RepID=UPI003D360303
MYRFTFAAALALIASPAVAQDTGGETAPPPPFKASGSVALVSDYRFRGVSQSDKQFALQGGITVTHEIGL